MKKYVAIIYRKLLSPSTRYELREAAAWLREKLDRVCFWRWEISRLPQRDGSPYGILYLGRTSRMELAKALLWGNENISISQTRENLLSQTVLISEIAIPGALRVPCYLISIVALGPPLAEITARYGKSVRQFLRTHRAGYYKRQALEDAEIDCADRMIQAYAVARHGDAAAQVGSDNVRKLAKDSGCLHLLYFDGEIVGCSLGYALSLKGKRYWVGVRVGYPESVFSNPKRLREVNAINNYTTLEWANEHGFDYHDNGISLARPDDGLLQWKKSRGSALDTMGNHSYFYVRLPKEGTAQFLWESPLFAVEHHNLTLHLGLPDGPSDEEIAVRYREMGFGGLFKIHLHCTRLPSERLLEKLRSLYTHQKSPPILEIIPSTS